MHLGPAEQVVQPIRTDLDLLDLMGRYLAGDFSAEATNLPFQLTNTGFPGVLGNDALERVRTQVQLLRSQTVGLELPRHQEPFGNFELLAFGITRKLDDFHAVEQGSRQVLQEIRRADEEHFREVEGHAEVMIDEGVVLGRIEDFEQGGRRVAVKGRAQLIDLVEQENRIFGSSLFHALEDPAWHCSHVSAPMAPDIRLVAGAAEGNADIFAAHGAGDRFGQGRFADTRRSGEEQDRGFRELIVLGGLFALPILARGRRLRSRVFITTIGRFRLGSFRRLAPGVFPQLAHGKEFQDAIFDIAQGIVVVFEDPFGFGDVQTFGAAFAPGQFGHGFEEGPDDLGLHGFPPHPLQAAQFAIDLLARFRRQVEGFETQSKLFELFFAVAFTEFFLDGFQLLAQENLFLPVAQLGLDLRLQVFLRGEHGELLLHLDEDSAQAIFDGQRLEQTLAVRHRNVDITSHQIGKTSRIFEAAQNLADGVFGQTGLLRELGRPRLGFPVKSHEGRFFRVERCLIFDRLDHRLQITLWCGFDAQDPAPFAGEKQHLDAGQTALHLFDAGDGADRKKPIGRHFGSVLLLGQSEHEWLFAGSFGSLDRFEGGRTPDRDRHGDAREQNELAQRQDGKDHRLGHERLTFWTGRWSSPRGAFVGARRRIWAVFAPSNVAFVHSIPIALGISESLAYRFRHALSTSGLDPCALRLKKERARQTPGSFNDDLGIQAQGQLMKIVL